MYVLCLVCDACILFQTNNNNAETCPYPFVLDLPPADHPFVLISLFQALHWLLMGSMCICYTYIDDYLHWEKPKRPVLHKNRRNRRPHMTSFGFEIFHSLDTHQDCIHCRAVKVVIRFKHVKVNNTNIKEGRILLW